MSTPAPALAEKLSALDPDEKMSKVQSIPFFIVHLMCLFVLQVGARPRDVLVCIGLYYFRMWAITAGYHRYFSHKTYKTSRFFQFMLAFFGSTSAQKGVLWWAANHRHHHKYSDQDGDIHSPTLKGFWFSHVGWILCPKYDATRWELIRDLSRYPELRWLNKYHMVPPFLLGVALFYIGGFSLLIWGLFVSTVLCWHGTFTINSLSHVFGKRRYKTTDTSRNSFLLALITCGEGWHNNHHFHANTANQGWFWWEIDFSYYALKALSVFGLVWDLRTPHASTKLAHLKYTDADRAQLKEEARGFRNPELVIARMGAKARLNAAVDATVNAANEAADKVSSAMDNALPPGGVSPAPVLKQ